MFGVSVTEIAMIAIVALVIVGPHKLPGLLRTLGQSIRKLRLFTTEMRAQTGIDEILREEGIQGGLTELRSLLHGDLRNVGAQGSARPPAAEDSPYPSPAELDRYREYPPEGVDAGGALPDDLVDQEALASMTETKGELAG